MTKKLFYEDSYQREFTACVTECIFDGDGYAIVLDETAFFPEGGGQYADTGVFLIDSEPVLVNDVQEKDDIIYHMTKKEIKPGTQIRGVLDWDLRFMKMQQHSGEHIVSGLVHSTFGYDNVGFHLGSCDCTMDFNGEISWDQLKEIELRANQVVADNVPILVSYPSREELAVLDYRSKIEIEGQVRIITIPGVDVCACCAPHVTYAGEVGQIKLVNVVRYKGGVRVTMLCGFRALEDYNRKLESAKKISALLCAKEDEIVSAVDHLKSELADAKLAIQELEKRLLAYKADELSNDPEFVCVVDDSLQGELPRLLMNMILEHQVNTCAVLVPSEAGCRYCIGSKTCDLRAMVKDLNSKFSGKGGGKPEMVQGSLNAGTEEEWIQWLNKKVRM